jgi:hypothetical protein
MKNAKLIVNKFKFNLRKLNVKLHEIKCKNQAAGFSSSISLTKLYELGFGFYTEKRRQTEGFEDVRVNEIK